MDKGQLEKIVKATIDELFVKLDVKFGSHPFAVHMLDFLQVEADKLTADVVAELANEFATPVA